MTAIDDITALMIRTARERDEALSLLRMALDERHALYEQVTALQQESGRQLGEIRELKAAR